MKASMKAMVLERITQLTENSKPLIATELVIPAPKANELLLKVAACGVCHTELDEIEGRTPPLRFPAVLGHQIVGTIASIGAKVQRFSVHDRVGVGWIYNSCGDCEYCQSGDENLCNKFLATGRDVQGGYAEYFCIDEAYAFAVPLSFNAEEVDPLLCAGAIGYRSLKLTQLKNGQRLGLIGFGASGHLVLKMARYLYPSSPVYVFARSKKERQFAQELGAAWVGDLHEEPRKQLHSMIDTTPVWKPIVQSMGYLLPRGRLVINAIRKEENDKEALLKLDYAQHLWMEKEIKSVANVSRDDIEGCLALAEKIPLKPSYEVFKLEQANEALCALKFGSIRGAKVLKI